MKKILINFAVVSLSAGLGLLLCEFGARAALNPADYLSVEIVGDNVLGAVPSPSAMSGFDAWGFRNRAVPKTADIVALGDSHTYGNTARMDESWPYVLKRLNGGTVYNMGMGGYGPNQYFYLLTTKALLLKPRMIVCGLYLGDDFENAFSITYGLDHWTYLRKLRVQDDKYATWDTDETPKWNNGMRVWLSRHSVMYQLVFHGPVAGMLQTALKFKSTQQTDPAVTSLIVPDKDIKEAFRPKGILNRIDQGSPRIQEGMRITFELLKQMDDVCHQHGVQFLVVVIPTKEMVFSDYLEHNPKVALSSVLDQLVANERLAEEITFTFLRESNIAYVNTLPALKGAVENHLYARTTADMHPGKNGYRVIGQAVAAALEPKQ